MVKKISRSKLKTGLPKETLSLCPDCRKIIKARIFEENGDVMMEKECAEHGKFKDKYWSDAKYYLWAEKYAYDGDGIKNPRTKSEKDCPGNCGICDEHMSHTVLANLDLTNRCNLRCPVCFANANDSGYVYEPSYEEIVKMMENLRANLPVATPAIQFSGGEPTMHPRFFDIVKKARELGFAQVQVATNGIKIAADPEYANKMKDAGVQTVYLQFDGLKEENYIAARGKPLLKTKLKAIEHLRNTRGKPLSTVLVPTIINGINDDQCGEILKFAIENRDVIRCINYQPVSFTGRISKDELEAQRFTISDLADRLEKQTNYVNKYDFYPVPFVAPISYMASVVSGKQKVAFTSHPHCGVATFLYIDDDGKVTPINRFVDVDGLLAKMNELGDRASGFLAQVLLKVGKKVTSNEAKKKAVMKNFNKYFGEYIDHDKIPEGLNLDEIITGLIATGDRDPLSDFTWKLLMIGGMHFQDCYNYDVERIKRCTIHYSVPDGRIIPFCSYNGGPQYRDEIEKKFSVPLDEWKKSHKGTEV
jgi:uncharacterized radical SAM superfamily Fe-S cluster-containing enzyme